MTDTPIIPLTEETEALDRIARTHDGRLLHRYLRRVLESCRASDESGALQRHEGGRILAADLMRHMAQGIGDTSDGRDQPIVSSPRQSGSGGLSRSERRRQFWEQQRDAEQRGEPVEGDPA
jgi:hypothetical protein